MSYAIKFFLYSISLVCYINSHATSILKQEDVFHVAMVSPRGEQRLEVAFMDEFRILNKGRVRYTFIQPNVNNSAEMLGLPDRVRKLKPNLVFTFGTPTTLAIAGTTDNPIIDDIPIVFSPVSYPVRSGIISNKPNPKRLITGTSHIAPAEVHFEMMMKFKGGGA